MAEEKREKTPAKEKKPSAYDVPFNTAKKSPAPAQKATEKKPDEAPVKKPADAPAKDKPAREQTPQKNVRNASNAPDKKAPVRKEASTATSKKPPERSANEKKEKKEDDRPRSMRPAHRALPYLFIVSGAFIGITLILNLFCNFGNKLEATPTEHWMGIVGYGISFVLNGLFGPAVLVFPVLLIVLGIFWRRYVDHRVAVSKIIATFIFLITFGAIFHIFNLIVEPGIRGGLPAADLFRFGAQSLGGGLLGGAFGHLLYSLCRFVGSLIVAFLILAISLFYLLGMTPQYVWESMRNRRRARPKRSASLSEENAEEAGNRAKMDEKIKRTTARRTDGEEEGEKKAPAGAVRVVDGQKKSSDDGIAPMPMPRLDPNDGDDLFVPEAVSERMAKEEEENAIAEEIVNREMAQHATTQVGSHAAPASVHPAEPAPTQAPPAPQNDINPAANRDAAVEPIFPKASDARVVRRVPRADRDFDLRSIFDEPISVNTERRQHAPVPPEVPLAPPRPKAAQPQSGAKTAAPTAVPVKTTQGVPARPTQSVPARPTAAQPPKPSSPSVNGSLRSPLASGTAKAAPATAAKAPTAPTAQRPLPKQPAPPKAVVPQNREFGLSNEEFEKLEAQQVTLPRAKSPSDAAKKPTDAASKATKPVTAAKVVEKAPKPAAKPKKYVFPPISYLHEAEKMSAENLAEIQANMDALGRMLKSFHIAIEDEIRYACGPTVTRYEITPAPGVRVRSITNLADDIALALRAPGKIRIEAPIPGTNAVGIEVPNRTRSTIYLRELIESKPFKDSKNKLTACLGAGVAGEPLVFEINKMPHLLVAGTTNSGKSVCINSIIMSLLYRLTPDEIKFVMIDPKKVEFTSYQNIPHLMAPVVTAPADAAGALQACVEEMERRYELFANVGVRDIKGFASATADDPDMPHLPYIIIIIDELADLMMTARDEVETAICRIAQKARAAGMHLIIGTQRPSADVVTGLIKSNVPSRIAFTVKSQVDSRVILDGIGAESLTGMGDMLFVPVGAMRNERVQGTFVSDKEVEKICEFVRVTNGSAEYDTNFITKLKELASQCGNKGKSGGDTSISPDDIKGDDNKYADALRVAIEEKRISTSLLQRKLEIGYSRAAKLIDRMQAEGYVSPPDGSKPRAVLITAEQYMEKFVDNQSGGEE